MAKTKVKRAALTKTVPTALSSAHHAGSSTLLIDAIFRIWLVVSILFIALASVPRSVAVHVPAAWHLVRRRGPLALAGVAMLLGYWMGYVILVLQGPVGH